jgi:transcriptional regulator with XRE-family HTH domain
MKNIRRTLGKKIRNLRALKNLTQEQLAERAELSVKYLGEIERGGRNPTIESLSKIVRALDIPLAQLFREDEEDKIFSRVSRKDLQAIRKTLEILGRVFGRK